MKRVIFSIFFLLSFGAISQEDTLSLPQGSTIKIAVKHAPPFTYVDETGVHGPIVDFWETIDRTLGWESEYVVYQSIEDILSAVESGEVHMSVNPVTVTADRLDRVHFTQPFYITDTTVLRAKSNPYWSFVTSIFTWKFLSAILGLGVIILFFGLLVWGIEHRKNKEFRKGVRGIGDGFWWSAVTMTTVGYGDKAPKTPAGRIVAFVWMITAVVGISGLTAGIASSLTTKNIEDEIKSVRDLRQYNVVTVAGTSTDTYLQSFNIPFVSASSIDEGLELVASGKVEMFIYDRILLLDALSKSAFGDDLEVMDARIRTDYYSFPITKNANVLDKVNPELVKGLNGIDWIAIRDRYGIK